MSDVMGAIFAGFGGAAGHASGIMTEQRDYEMRQAEKDADAARALSLKKAEYAMGAPDRAFAQSIETGKLGNESGRLAVSERQVGTQEQQVANAAQNTAFTQGRQTAADAAKVEQTAYDRSRDRQGDALTGLKESGQWGKDPNTGEVKPLTVGELKSGKFDRATPKEIVQAEARVGVAGIVAEKGAKFDAGVNMIMGIEGMPEDVKGFILDEANKTGINPAIILAGMQKKQDPPTAAQAEVIHKMTEAGVKRATDTGVEGADLEVIKDSEQAKAYDMVLSGRVAGGGNKVTEYDQRVELGEKSALDKKVNAKITSLEKKLVSFDTQEANAKKYLENRKGKSAKDQKARGALIRKLKKDRVTVTEQLSKMKTAAGI